MSQNVARLGEYVEARRRALGMSQIDVWKAGGPSNSTLTGIESGTSAKVSPSTLRKLDSALGWTEGSAGRTLNGGEPTLVETSTRSNRQMHDIATLLDRLLEDTEIIVKEARAIADPGSRVVSISEDAFDSAVAVCIHILGGEESVMKGAAELLAVLGEDESEPTSLIDALEIVIKAQVATNAIWGGPMIQARQGATSYVQENDPVGDQSRADYELVSGADRQVTDRTKGERLHDEMSAAGEESQVDPGEEG